ncbi:hypothetical protein SEA_AGGIE_32 [Mycobacterium phage Aggie]|uniref:Lipoprotein n=2 Tax=Caudoviricetes TaxID=2731619 RepID=A0A385D0P0_9CAUD|nr:membrane protein [Mycobacterium phage Aggie]AXQ51397.1 hypothetical protein SEA_AGGIE_32 [Mycobacterium phage Aggie]
MSEPSRKWRRLAVIAAPLVLAGGCVAALIPRAPVEQIITEDGTYEVGCLTCDMGAGVWQTTEGLWIRKSSPQVSLANELARGRVKPGETATVHVEAGEFFTTMWCSPWKRVARG